MERRLLRHLRRVADIGADTDALIAARTLREVVHLIGDDRAGGERIAAVLPALETLASRQRVLSAHGGAMRAAEPPPWRLMEGT